MRPEEREKMLAKARKLRANKQGVKRLQGTAVERATASEFGAAMSPTMSKDDKARASKRSNPKDLRYTGTDAKKKVLAGEAARKTRSRTMEAAAAKRKITQAEAKTKPVTKKPAAKTSTTTAAPKKPATGKNYNVGVSKGGVSFGEAFKHFRKTGAKTFTWNGKKYTTEVAKAKPKAKISTPTPADFTATGKKPTTNAKTKARDLTLRDKGGISARRNTKGPLAKARKEYPVTGPGSQSKILRKKKAK